MHMQRSCDRNVLEVMEEVSVTRIEWARTSEKKGDMTRERIYLCWGYIQWGL